MIFAFYLLDKMDLFGAIKLERDKHVIQKLDESIVQSITSLNMIIAEIERYLDVGRFPGKSTIEKSLLTLQRLLGNSDSVDFFKEVVDNQNDYLDLEEDYRDLNEFFTNQLHSWQQLQQALRRFEKNRNALEKNDSARKAMVELQAIESHASPYNQLHKVSGLVETVEAVNVSILTEQREQGADAGCGLDVHHAV